MGGMTPDATEELLNVYDAEGRVVGAQPRRAAKASGLAVGAVNVLVLSDEGRVLMQRRPADKENGGRWDKSVGGHVSAGEDFDTTVVREAGEELFDDPRSAQVRLARDEREFEALEGSLDLRRTVLLVRVGMQRSLRDVRHAPGGGLQATSSITSRSTTAARPSASRTSARRRARSTSCATSRRRRSTSSCSTRASRRTWRSCGSRRPSRC